jgi:hypothetical protein
MNALTDHALARMSAANTGPDVKTISDDRIDGLTLRNHFVSQVLDQTSFNVTDTAAAVYRVRVAAFNVSVVHPSNQTVKT